MQKNRSSKQTFMFFLIYFALLCSLIFAAVTLKPSFLQEQPSEISSAFSKELEIHKHKQEKKTAENEGKWQPSYLCDHSYFYWLLSRYYRCTSLGPS